MQEQQTASKDNTSTLRMHCFKTLAFLVVLFTPGAAAQQPGSIITVAGDGGISSGGDGFPALSASVPHPRGIVFDTAGSLYITSGSAIRRVAPNGIIETFVVPPLPQLIGGITIGSQTWISGLTIDQYSNLYIYQGSSIGTRVLKVDQQRQVTIVLDKGVLGTDIAGMFDGGYWGLAASSNAIADGLFIADASNHRILRRSSGGQLFVYAGQTGVNAFGGDGGRATSAFLNTPTGLALDPEGNLYIADSQNHRVRRVTPNNLGLTITTIAGSGGPGGGFSGDGGLAVNARLNTPTGLAFDRFGNLYIADMRNSRIRKVDRNGIITTVGGSGNVSNCYSEACYSGDGGPAVSAQLSSWTEGLTVDVSGNLYIADRGNHRVRKLFARQASEDLTVNMSLISFNCVAGSPVSSPESVAVTLTNTGSAVTYSIATSKPWIQVSKSGGSLTENGSDTFFVSVLSENLSTGTFEESLTITAPGRPTRTVAVAVNAAPPGVIPQLQVFPSRLDFVSTGGVAPPPQALVIRSSDTSTIAGTVTVSGPGSLVSRTTAFATPSIAEFETRSAVGTLPSNSTISLVPSNSQVPVVNIPVTIHDGGPRVYSIPSVVDGGGFTTAITIVNLDTVEAVVSLEFHRVAGAGGETGLWLPQMANNAAILGATIPPGGSRTWSTTGNPSLADVGWARIRTGQRVGGFAVLKQTVAGRADQEAAIPVVSSWQQRFLLPFDNTGGLVTALALTNASDRESGEVRAYFRDETGQPIAGSYQRALPANGHVAFASPEVLPFLNGRRGTAEFVMAGGRMSAVGLRFGASAFTSFEAQSLNESSSGRLILPHIADGSAGGATFLTSITLVNRDVVPATVSLRFYRRTGVATATAIWTPPMIGYQGVQNVTIPPGTSRVWQTAGTGMLEQGWGEILTSQRVTGFAVFLQRIPGRTDQEAAVPLNAGPSLRFLLPFDNQGFTTTMALVNFSGGATATVRAIVRDEQHRVLSDGTLTLPPGGHTAFTLPAQFPATGSRRGTIEFLTQSGELSALGLRFAGEAFTSFRPQVF